MKKILASLSLFLLTNVSLAISFDIPIISGGKNPVYTPAWDHCWLIIIVTFLAVFIISMINIVKNNLYIQKTNNIEQKKKIKRKMLLYLLFPLIVITIGNIVLYVLYI